MNRHLATTFALLLLAGCSMKTLREEHRENPSTETAEEANDSLNPPPSRVKATEGIQGKLPSTMMASHAGDIDASGDMEIKLKNANGKVIGSGTSPSQINVDEPKSTPETASASPAPTASATAADVTPYEHDPEAGTPPAVDPTPPQFVPLAQVRQPGPVPADKALTWLKNGNRRFTKGFLRNDGQSKKDIQRLIKAQTPHTVILSCSDSRMPPEILFDQKLGEVSVVRNLGPVLDTSVIASIEYAVQQYGTNLVLVMGHNRCETLKAAMSSQTNPPSKSRWFDKTIAAMHPRLGKLSRGPASADLGPEAWANVGGVASDLISRSAVIQEAIQSGTLKVQEAVYDIDHGSVAFKTK
jgi:carbonic anhydrase